MSTMSATSSSFFKCNSCAIQFPHSDAQRYHMKTDWHRYNLKRRVAGLTAVDAAVYAEKVQQSQQFMEETDEFGFRITRTHEQKPKKLHVSHRSHFNHPLDAHHRGRVDATKTEDTTNRDHSPESVASELSRFSLGDSVYSVPETHTDIDSNFETASEAASNHYDPDYVASESDDDDDSDLEYDSNYEEEPIQPITSCIYCGIPHADIETNVTHMFRNHGLYIPERTYLTDLRGLLGFLISTIVIENHCLCCSFQGRNLESIRAHVTSKGHCRLPYETREERALFSKFYDFSSLHTETAKAKSNKSVGFSEDANETIVIEDAETSSDDSEGETNSDDNGMNDNYALATIDPVDSQLTLPNGSRLGHRSLNRIYRQHINIPRDPAESQLTVVSADRRLASGLTLSEANKQMKEAQIVEQKQKNKFFRRETRKRINFQPHYRDPMLGG